MKLSPLTIYVVGICIAFAAIMVSLSIFMPNVEEAKINNNQANALIDEAGKQPLANKRVEKAIEEVNKMAAQWQNVVAAKTPPSTLPYGINLAVNRWQLTQDSVTFRNNIQRAVNYQLRKGGVTVVNGPNIPQPPANANQIVEYYNYPAIRFPVLIFDLGQVTVKGSYSQIMNNVRSWKYMPNYLAVTDGLQITGTTPTMTGRYNLTMVAYIRGDQVGQTVPEGGGGGGGGGGAAQGTNPSAGAGGIMSKGIRGAGG
ncbi:MAG: hypothetical protein JNM34_05810 [Chthonomonadaceae bacterium]|nr:hypothetical protein [Chthonomonadaceae bacterium]